MVAKKILRIGAAYNASVGLRIALVVLSTVSVLAVVVAMQISKIRERTESFRMVMEHSIEQRVQLSELSMMLKDAVILHDRFLRTEDEIYLDQFKGLKQTISGASQMWLALQEDRGAQLARSLKLIDYIGMQMIELDRAVTERVQGGSLTPVIDANHSYIEGEIKKLIDDMIAFEEREILLASQIIDERTRRSRKVTTILLGSIVALVTAVAMLGVNYLTRRSHIELALREAMSLAEKASEAKTEFLASMSHEIRTPLTGVLGFSELLLNENLTRQQRQLAERIQMAGTNLSGIVNDILDFSKIEARQVTLELELFSPRALVENALSIISVTARKKNLELRLVIDPGLPKTLIGDEPRLRQILLNLLSNAVKFTNAGHVGLAFHHEGSSKTGELVRIEVTDTGIGFAPDKRDLLFTRFSQLDASIRREFGGTGLGLAISKQLIELMGGQIGVESEEGRGTKFWFVLTLLRAADNEEQVFELQSERCCVPGRILLVEDSVQNQELVSKILRSAGHQVDIANDGIEAIGAVQAVPYNLVLMDVQMPRMDGPTATTVIRGLDHPSSDIPIIALTANVLPQQVNAFHEAGINDFIAKPFRSFHLLATVAKWMPVLAVGRPADNPGIVPNSTHDAQTLKDIQDLMGEEWVLNCLRRLRKEINETFIDIASVPADQTELKQKAHMIVSHSAQLGFHELSRSCSELEELCRAGGEFLPALNASQRASRAAVEKIDQILGVAVAA